MSEKGNSYIEKAQESDRQLRKSLGLLEIMFLVLGAIIGSGWLFGSFYAAEVAGPAATLSWIIAGVLLLFVALAFAELSGAIPRSGAIVRYPQYTHGSFASTVLGWAYFLSAVTVAPAEAEAAVTYITTWWPKTWPALTYTVTVLGVTETLLTGVGFALAFALLTAFFLLNWFGVRLLGAVTHGAGWWKLVIPFVTVFLVLILVFQAHNFGMSYNATGSLSFSYPGHELGVSVVNGTLSLSASSVTVIRNSSGLVELTAQGVTARASSAVLTFPVVMKLNLTSPSQPLLINGTNVTVSGLSLAAPNATIVARSAVLSDSAAGYSIAVTGGTVVAYNSTVRAASSSLAGNASHGFLSYGWAPVFFALPTTGIVFAYLGFRQGLEFAGEARNPQRDVPLGTILGFVIAIVLYVLLQVSFIGGVDWHRLNLIVSFNSTVTQELPVTLAPGNWSGLGLTALSSGPFYELLAVTGILVLTGWAFILLIDAVVSPSGTGWIYEGTTTRVLYGMAADGVLPEWFLRLNKYKIPWIALIASWLLGAFFMLPFPGWALIVSFISLTTVLTYIIGGSALVVLRRTAPEMPRPFRAGGDRAVWVIGAIAFIASYLIVYWSEFSTLWLATPFILVGLGVYYALVAPSRFGVRRSHGIAAAVVFWAVLGVTTYFLVWRNVMSVAPVSASPLTVLSLVGYVVINIAVAVGLTEFLRREMNEEGRLHTASGYWVLAVLFSAYVLSFLGQYGPFTKPIIPFPYDTVVAAVLALATFIYSVYSGVLTRDLEAVLRDLGVIPSGAQAGGS